MAKNRAVTTTRKHATLKTLSKRAKENIHEMLRLTTEILEDLAYVDEYGGQNVLLDELEENEFGHFGGNPSLRAMLKAYRLNPDKAVWQEHNFNIRVMIDLTKPERKASDEPRTNWKARCAELEERVRVLEAENKTLRELIVGQRVAAVV